MSLLARVLSVRTESEEAGTELRRVVSDCWAVTAVAMSRKTEKDKTGFIGADRDRLPSAFSGKFAPLPKGIGFLSKPFFPVRIFLRPALLIAITLLNSASSLPKAEFKVDTVVIDAGHGGKDPGTRGKLISEKTVTLNIALKVGAYIEKNHKDVKVIYTRKGDQYVALDERADIANRNKADLFVSIHANAISNPAVYGTETWVMGLHKTDGNLEVAQRENSVMLLDEKYEERYEGFDPKSPESYILFSLTQSAFQSSSLSFASKVEEECAKSGRRDRGVKQSGFWVLWRTAMPSALIEVGFLSNASEEKFLATEKGQDALAAGIYRAFASYKKEVESIN
jgi:N-acetylmuramoyl-L-alanine amidase